MSDLRLARREVVGAARYAATLPAWLRRPLGESDARALVARGVADRAAHLVELLERGVYGARDNVFGQLLTGAGIERGDAVALVRDLGVEGALARLYEAGAYLSFDEFKGFRPVERNGVSRLLGPVDLFNPLLGPEVGLRSVGSRGAVRRSALTLEDVEHTAAYTALFLTAFDAWDRPVALWRPAPPGRAGLGHALQLAKLGKRIDVWFSQNGLSLTIRTKKEYALTRYTLRALRRAGYPVVGPLHVPLANPQVVAAWLAERVREGRPAHVSAPASAGVRVCRAAADRDLDISGTLFRVGGEPYTEAKARVFGRVGCRAVCHYTMSEVGRIGSACAEPRALDDVHVNADRIALIQRDRPVGRDGASVAALHVTTLGLDSRTLLVNVETDDYGVLEHRECGCAFGEIGLSLHLHTIRSYDKLTTEGMNFVGAELLRLVEDVLPSRFGGEVTDYQLLEQEEDDLPKVSVVVAPHVELRDEKELVRTVLEVLGGGSGAGPMMASIWHDAETVRVERRPPHATASGKILPLLALDTRARTSDDG